MINYSLREIDHIVKNTGNVIAEHLQEEARKVEDLGDEIILGLNWDDTKKAWCGFITHKYHKKDTVDQFREVNIPVSYNNKDLTNMVGETVQRLSRKTEGTILIHVPLTFNAIP